MSILDKTKCKICGYKSMNYNSLAQHIKKHNISSKEYYDTYIEPNKEHKCKFCGKDVSNRFLNINKGYLTTCGIECLRKNVFKNIDYKKRNKKMKKTNLKKYGVDNISKNKKIHEKGIKKLLNKTKKEKEYILNKKRLTSLIRYGVTHPMKKKEIYDKVKNTMMKKYGYEHYLQSSQNKMLIKKKFMQKYGVENPSKSKTIIKKIKQTKKQRYGNANYNNIEKTRKTNLKKYGVECCWSNNDVRKKCAKKYYYDNKYFDSSYELYLYIYLKDKKINFEYQPNIYFVYEYKKRKYRYFPDFKIRDKLYEIKGQQFIDKNGKWKSPYKNGENGIYEAKRKCVIKNNVKILLYDKIKPYINKIDEKYGKNYIKQFRERRIKI